MKHLALALLLMPFHAFAQFENNPNQQRLWEGMINMAPAYEMLLACERDVTADLIYKDMTRMAAAVVQNRRDVEIAMEMWNRARAEASLQYYDSIGGLANNPNGDACNNLENEIIEILGEGV